MQTFLSSPPVALFVFGSLAYGLYRLGCKIGARGRDHPGKGQPYACGEDIPAPATQQAYHAFFRLALMFAILHLAALVVSTLPVHAAAHRLATFYLIGIGVSVLVLTKGE
jgi:NADH:ubiquinone oxidoreductase subunit 3 (subunit A)